MRFRGLTILTMAGTILFGGMASSALAQTFSLESVEARAGTAVNVRLFVTGGPANTSALNFTINYDPTQVASITGVRAPGIAAGYVYDQNTPTSGQYRGVLYAQNSSVAAFSTVNQTHVATLTVTLQPGLAAGTRVPLTLMNIFEQPDNITGLVGLSDSAGVSVVPGGNPRVGRPSVTNGQVTVLRSALLEQDFTGANSDGFSFNNVPFGPGRDSIVGASTADGYRVTLANKNPNPGKLPSDTSYARLGANPSRRITPDANSMVVLTADVRSNAVDPRDNPTFRFAFTAEDFSYAQLVNITEADNALPSLFPFAGNDRRYETVAFVPDFVADTTEGRTGYLVAFDMIAVFTPSAPELYGKQGTEVTVRRFEVNQLPAPASNAGQLVFSQEWTEDDEGGFISLAGGSTAFGNHTANFFADNGLGIQLAFNPTQTPSELNFPFGGWTSLLPGVTVDSSKVYRIDAVIATNATTPANTHTIRLRLVGTGDFTAETVLTPSGTPDAAARPNATGKNYTALVRFPSEVEGAPIRFWFDGYTTSANTNGSIFLRSLRITAHDL